MSNETIILLQNLSTVSSGSAFSFTNKTPGPGYYRQDDTTRTVLYDFTNFVGTVKIQASLELQPGDNDWFDVGDTIYTTGSAASTTENYSFTGNFIWIRAAYNLQSGSITRVAVDGITVTSSSSISSGGSPTTLAFSNITNKPTTVLGYGITDAVSASDLGAFEFTNSVITTTDSSAVTIDQATTITSDLTVGGDILPSIANGGDLGSSTNPWRSLYVSNNTIYLGEAALGINQSGELTVNGSSVAGSATPAWADITGKPTFAAVATSGSYADLSNKPTIPALGNIVFSANNITNPVGEIINIQAPFSQLLSTDGAFIWVQDGYGAGIEVNSNIWKFDASGDLTFPDATVQTTAWTGTYTATTAGDWNGTAPTTIASAIDRLAAAVKALNGTGA